MKLYFRGHDCKYAAEQMLPACFRRSGLCILPATPFPGRMG